MRLLIVDDDRKAAQILARGLREERFVVDVASTAEQGDEMATATDYDLIVLDWLLPDQEGTALCREWRARGLAAPILMLTARDALEDRVTGLNTGADDYLVKPFGFSELIARIHALLRRSELTRPVVLAVADLTLDPQSHRACLPLVPGPVRPLAARASQDGGRRRSRDPEPAPPHPRDGAGRGDAVVPAPGQAHPDRRSRRSRRRAQRESGLGPPADSAGAHRPAPPGRARARDAARLRRRAAPAAVGAAPARDGSLRDPGRRLARRRPRRDAVGPLALPGHVAGHPRRGRAHRGDAGPGHPAADRPDRAPGPGHGGQRSRRAAAAPRRPGRDQPARGDAQRDAGPCRARLRGPAPLHRGRLPRAAVAALAAARRARGDAPAAARPPGGRGGAALLPGRGGAPLASDRGAAHARPPGRG